MNKGKLPLMRKAIAVWLVDNTSLTFEQIANFCGMHELEIQGIADGEVAGSVIPQNPVDSGQLTKDMIKSCEEDPEKHLELKQNVADDIVVATSKKSKYTPIARRSDKPNGIAYLLKYYPDITDAQIKKIIGTTSVMIDSIRNRTHWNIKEIVPRDPVLLGLCSQALFNKEIGNIVKSSKK